MRDYAKAEERASKGEKVDAVLVAAGSVNQLSKAYPNFFLDTSKFVIHVRNIIRTAIGTATESKIAQ